jgi:parvulin-like peptidyl-prolyl isomerase
MLKARLAALAALVSVTACEGLKEAMTAHVDVVARAEKQELSVQKLADWVGPTQLPLSTGLLEQVASVWVSYQLMAKAASVGDSLVDTVLIDKVMKPVYDQTKTQRWQGMLQGRLAIDTSNLEAAYNEGHLLAARHILFPVPAAQQASGSDSVMRRAEAIRRTATTQNFAALAKQHGSDGTKDAGGDLGVFEPTQMIPDFTRGVQAMKPGEIGPLVRTEHGYHIVRRSTYDEVRDQFDAQYKGMLRQKAQFAYVEQLMTAKKVEVKPNAPKLLKEVAADLDAHKGNRSALATFTNGTLTAGDAAQIFNGMPAQQREQMRQQIAQFPDSILDQVVKSMVVNELMVQQADSAGIKVDSLELNNIRNAFKGVVRNVWAGLRISPESLADSAKTPAEKERLAAARIDAYMGRLLSGQGENYVDVPAPVAEALREKYDGSVKAAGLTRALELAQKARAASDSSTAGAQPKSAVPMPDTGRGGGAPKR